jgi:hypothetical protein
VAPFQGCLFFLPETQGVALGFYLRPLRGKTGVEDTPNPKGLGALIRLKMSQGALNVEPGITSCGNIQVEGHGLRVARDWL